MVSLGPSGRWTNDAHDGEMETVGEKLRCRNLLPYSRSTAQLRPIYQPLMFVSVPNSERIVKTPCTCREKLALLAIAFGSWTSLPRKNIRG
jgi:hypothetical protein